MTAADCWAVKREWSILNANPPAAGARLVQFRFSSFQVDCQLLYGGPHCLKPERHRQWLERAFQRPQRQAVQRPAARVQRMPPGLAHQLAAHLQGWHSM